MTSLGGRLKTLAKTASFRTVRVAPRLEHDRAKATLEVRHEGRTKVYVGGACGSGGGVQCAPVYRRMRRVAGGVSAAAAPANVAQPNTPVVVGCEPNQRTLVRPSVINGMTVSQVDCVSVSQFAVSTQTPVAQQPGFVPVNYQPAAPALVTRNADLADTRIIPASYPATTVARPVLHARSYTTIGRCAK